MNSLSEGLEGRPVWLDLHSVQRDKGSVREWQKQHLKNIYDIATQIQHIWSAVLFFKVVTQSMEISELVYTP